MSGHSKWHSIKHKKGLADAKRGATFTKHSKLITIAAKEGGDDPEMNPALKSAIENAKADNLPNANIERAVKKGTGELKDGVEISEVMYAGYGPSGVAFFIYAVTDNKNRTVSDIKNILNKHGGTMAETGAVAFMFERKGLIYINAKDCDKNLEEIELLAIDAGADDIKNDGDLIEVYTAPAALYKVKKNLETNGIKVTKAEQNFIAKNTVSVSEEEKAKKILNLISALEEHDDVSNVYSNFDIAEDILEKIANS